MAMSTLKSGPKLDWTRDNQMYECYRIWKKKVEFIFCSALADATPMQLVSYLKYWMGDQGIPLIEKWESTGKLDYSNAEETPTTEGGRRRVLSSGYRVQTYWDLLDEEFKPKGNKLLSIIELWTHSKQGDKPLNQWLTHVYNLVNVCKYPEDSTDRIIRDVLIISCNSNHTRDKIIRQGETATLNQVIEILQTEESTRSTMQQIQASTNTAPINYVSYDSRSKKSKTPSNEQNSSSPESTGSKRQCSQCHEPFSKKHMKECRAQNVTCNGCGIKGHLKKCCKKSGNFPKDSNQQNQSSLGSTKMNYASAAPLPQIKADFFGEKEVPKEYRPPVQQQQIGGMFVLRKVSIDPSSVSDPVPNPAPDSPFQEFPLTEVVTQSQTDSSSISDTSDSRENNNSSRKATKGTNSPLKSMQNRTSHEEMREIRDPDISALHTQSSRDSSTISISDNSTPRESISGIMNDTPTTFPAETDIAEKLSSNNRSVMPTDVQALTAVQSLVSDDFQAKHAPSTQRKREDTHSTQRKGEDTHSTQRKGEDEAFQLIQKIHNQLQQVQWDLQRLHSLHKYKN